MQAFSGAGAEVKLRMPTQPSVTISAQVLSLTRMRRQQVHGEAGFDASSDTYSFDIHGQKAGGNLTFPFMRSYASRGVGLLLGADTSWTHGAFSLRLGARDLGWLYWDRLPEQESVLTTRTRAIDENGFVIYKPALEGRNMQRGYLTRPVPRVTGSGAWSMDAGSDVDASLEFVPGFGVLPAVGWQTMIGVARVRLAWRFHERRLEMGIDAAGLTVKLGTDTFGGSAKSRVLSVGLRKSF